MWRTGTRIGPARPPGRCPADRPWRDGQHGHPIPEPRTPAPCGGRPPGRCNAGRSPRRHAPKAWMIATAGPGSRWRQTLLVPELGLSGTAPARRTGAACGRNHDEGVDTRKPAEASGCTTPRRQRCGRRYQAGRESDPPGTSLRTGSTMTSRNSARNEATIVGIHAGPAEASARWSVPGPASTRRSDGGAGRARAAQRLPGRDGRTHPRRVGRIPRYPTLDERRARLALQGGDLLTHRGGRGAVDRRRPWIEPVATTERKVRRRWGSACGIR